jgi:PAS domain-containing protein
VLRHGAALATDVQEISADYGTALVAPGSFADALFRQDSAQSLRDGYVFKPGPTLKGGQYDRSDWGYWACEIADHNRLTWSDTVYDLFGLAPNALVDRDWAVGRYVGHSRLTLQRVREFALRHAWGFILDAEIEPENGHRRWIRVLAVPVSEDGRVTRLHGLKRAL